MVIFCFGHQVVIYSNSIWLLRSKQLCLVSFNVYGYDVYISLIVHLHGVNLGQIFNVIVKIENMFKIWSLLMKSDIKLPWVVEMMSIKE